MARDRGRVGLRLELDFGLFGVRVGVRLVSALGRGLGLDIVLGFGLGR